MGMDCASESTCSRMTMRVSKGVFFIDFLSFRKIRKTTQCVWIFSRDLLDSLWSQYGTLQISEPMVEI